MARRNRTLDYQDLGYGLALIELTRGQDTVVDRWVAEHPDISRWNWSAQSDPRRGRIAAMRRQGRDPGTGQKRCVYLHREVFRLANPGVDMSGLEVDHMDGDPLNNTLFNLRLATTSENGRNRGTQRNNTSGFKGVYFCKRTGKWHAQIKAGGKRHSLGYFSAAEAAYTAYCEAAQRLHGEFARTA